MGRDQTPDPVAEAQHASLQALYTRQKEGRTYPTNGFEANEFAMAYLNKYLDCSRDNNAETAVDGMEAILDNMDYAEAVATKMALESLAKSIQLLRFPLQMTVSKLAIEHLRSEGLYDG